MNAKRIVVTHYGGLDSLQVIEDERPEPMKGEARVRILAAGVSLPDIMAREGVHPETPRTPYTPGWDLVGVVDRLGAAVSGIELGQRVAAMPISGAYAEFLCLPDSARRFPLARAREAQELLARGGVTGKIVLECSETSPEAGCA